MVVSACCALLPPNELEKNPVDAFLIHKLRENGLGFSGPATPATLIRRHLLCSRGSHQGRERLSVRRGRKTDAEGAYLRCRNLLASPHFGERWAHTGLT